MPLHGARRTALVGRLAAESGGRPTGLAGGPWPRCSLTAEDAFAFTAFSSLPDDLSIERSLLSPWTSWVVGELQSSAIARQPLLFTSHRPPPPDSLSAAHLRTPISPVVFRSEPWCPRCILQFYHFAPRAISPLAASERCAQTPSGGCCSPCGRVESTVPPPRHSAPANPSLNSSFSNLSDLSDRSKLSTLVSVIQYG